MKKVLTTILMFVMAVSLMFTFAACGASEKTSLSDEEVQDILDAIEGGEEVDYGNLSKADKKAIEEAAEEEGIELSFGSDGEIVIKGEDGEDIRIGGDWPDNEFSKLLPKPTFGTSPGSSTDDESFAAAIS